MFFTSLTFRTISRFVSLSATFRRRDNEQYSPDTTPTLHAFWIHSSSSSPFFFPIHMDLIASTIRKPHSNSSCGRHSVLTHVNRSLFPVNAHRIFSNIVPVVLDFPIESIWYPLFLLPWRHITIVDQCPPPFAPQNIGIIYNPGGLLFLTNAERNILPNLPQSSVSLYVCIRYAASWSATKVLPPVKLLEISMSRSKSFPENSCHLVIISNLLLVWVIRDVSVISKGLLSYFSSWLCESSILMTSISFFFFMSWFACSVCLTNFRSCATSTCIVSLFFNSFSSRLIAQVLNLSFAVLLCFDTLWTSSTIT